MPTQLSTANTDSAAAVVRVVEDVLGDGVLGAYLHGSATLGGLRPHSDIDVLVVLHRPTTTKERRDVVARLLEISGARARRGPARPVELTMVVQSDVRPWSYPPRMEFLYGEWLRDDYEAGLVPSPTRNSDLTTLLTMVLQADSPIVGPPATALLDPVPLSDLRRAITEGVPGLLDELDTDTRNVLLTLVRIWATLSTGEVTSKDAAADWALDRVPEAHKPVLARARLIYLGLEDDRWTDLLPQVQSFAKHVVRQIQRTTTDAGDRSAAG